MDADEEIIVGASTFLLQEQLDAIIEEATDEDTTDEEAADERTTH